MNCFFVPSERFWFEVEFIICHKLLQWHVVGFCLLESLLFFDAQPAGVFNSGIFFLEAVDVRSYY